MSARYRHVLAEPLDYVAAITCSLSAMKLAILCILRIQELDVMKIRGWIYVLSNKAMPGLLKIGYSTKDPSLRIDDLNTTGLPHPFILEYDALVVGPRDVEQAVHSQLSSYHEAKEFFRVSVSKAVSTIKGVVTEQGKSVITDQINVNGGLATDIDHALYEKNTCRVCGYLNTSDNSRCTQCFALLP